MASFFKKYLDGRLPYLIKYMPIDLEKNYVYANESEKRTTFQKIMVFFKSFIFVLFTSGEEIRKRSATYEDNEKYDIVNDESIVLDVSSGPVYYIFGGAIILLGTFISIFLEHDISAFVSFLCISLPLFIYAYTSHKKYMILERKKGLFTFADWFYLKPHTVAFAKHNKFFWAGTGGASGALGQQLVTAPPKSARSIWITTHVPGFSSSWSFMLWYMDKNRPLPPGAAFDPYRAQDFERRKAEGFPPPLFKSTFPTPEATAEQNAERRKYWRDEDYYGETESVWY